MPLHAITEQQFRTRRKDRKMVWVDAAAFLFGLIMLLGGVGGVVMVEEEPEPFNWGYSFFEARDTMRHCVGFAGVREGCTTQVQGRQAEEGTVIKTTFDPVTQANVTGVLFTLRWVDEVPVTTGTPQECGAHCGKRYDYTNESTDILRLTVIPPEGLEPQSVAIANDQDTKSGEISFEWDFLTMPTPDKVVSFTMEDARSQVVDLFEAPSHGALGIWRAEVTVERAGDQNGTLPTSACPGPSGGVAGSLSGEAGEQCNLHTHQDTVEGAGGNTRLPTDYYASSYDDLGNKWMLDMVVRRYDVQLSIG